MTLLEFIREGLLDAMREQGLAEPERLRTTLGLSQAQVESILGLKGWSLETCEWLIKKLNLDFAIETTYTGRDSVVVSRSFLPSGQGATRSVQ